MEFVIKVHVEIERTNDLSNNHPHSWADALIKHAKECR